MDGTTGQVLAGPDLVSRGFVYVRENEELMNGARIAAEVHGLILEINHFVSRDIPPEDLAVFYNTLRTIAANLSKAVKYYT